MSEAAGWFAGLSRVLFVHAHPDDETITTGGTLAALAEAGREPLLITLTRGEQGEVVPGPMRALVQAHGLAVVRQNELKTAITMLGLERHAFLGVEPARAEGLSPTIYEDSGMAWIEEGLAGPAPEAGSDALTSVPAVEALNDLLAGAYLAGARAIVSYDDGGGYGHPDHVLAHRLSRAVAQALELPFWQIVPREDPARHEDPAHLDKLDERDARDERDRFDEREGFAHRACRDERGGPGVGIEIHDISPWLERKLAALRCYNTQLTVEPVEPGGDTGGASGFDIVHVGGQRQPIGTVEAFERLSNGRDRADEGA